MTPFKLTALSKSDESAPSIRVYKRSNMTKMATIWGDATISFNPEIDYEVEEISVIMELQKNFFTIYNSIIEKDEEISRLKKELNNITNPIISRQ